eukprot:jgi/Bigna1/91670/estExt_fgenesh1_pg.C_1120006
MIVRNRSAIWGPFLCVLVSAIYHLIVLSPERLLNKNTMKDLSDGYCATQDFTADESLLKNGFVHFKNFTPTSDLQNLMKRISNISYATRYVCGASDIQPEECMDVGEDIEARYPGMIRKLYGRFDIWRKKNYISKLKMDQWGQLRVMGSEFIAITAWKYPFSLLKGSWEYAMGPTLSNRLPRVFSLFKGWFTKKTGIPIYTGYHGWHTDGPDQMGGRFHKLFIMVEKTVNGNAASSSTIEEEEEEEEEELLLRHSNLRVIPKILESRLFEFIEQNRHLLKPAWRYTGLTGIVMDWLMEQIGCTIEMDVGDALFFRENVKHRTQDMVVSRYAMILDIQ